MGHDLLPPCYAVIFTSKRTGKDAGYAAMATRMEELARDQPGFLGIDSARGEDGLGISVSYWESLDAIARWKQNAEHLAAQELGKTVWYESYSVRIARVEKSYG